MKLLGGGYGFQTLGVVLVAEEGILVLELYVVVERGEEVALKVGILLAFLGLLQTEGNLVFQYIFIVINLCHCRKGDGHQYCKNKCLVHRLFVKLAISKVKAALHAYCVALAVAHIVGYLNGGGLDAQAEVFAYIKG